MDEFDSLRREATKLERHLEDRVARYQQLAQELGSNNSNNSLDSIEAGTSKNGTSVEEETALRNDIQRTLQTLQDLIDVKLSPASERSGKSQHMLLVKRYREIAFDLTSDFKKASSTLQRKREQAELFRGSSASSNGGGDGNDPAMDQLIRERNHINNSINAADAVLGQASEIHSDLRSQGASLRGVSGTLLRIGSNVPGLNRLIDNIRRKRSFDDNVVVGVVSACILFTLWYLFG